MLTVAVAPLVDLGVYPNNFAWDTTDSLNCAVSRNASFNAMLAFTALACVIYASMSMIVLTADPS